MKDRQPCQSEAEARLSSGSAIAVPAITISLKKQPLDCQAASTRRAHSGQCRGNPRFSHGSMSTRCGLAYRVVVCQNIFELLHPLQDQVAVCVLRQCPVLNTGQPARYRD